ncbi:SOS response-associated peptidase [Patescibacteria group bacterium]
MCGRFTLGIPDKIESRFETNNKLPLFKPSWNIAPSWHIPTITRNSLNKIIMMKWGLIFSKNSSFGTINIRAETTLEKPFFKHILLNKRCLMVADSFYEWGEVNLEGKEEKYPFNFYLKNRELFGFAGIYNDFNDAQGKPFYTCAMVTTTPNSLVKKAHNRMPVIIKKKDEEAWLNPENKDFNKLFDFLKPYPQKDMKMQIVGKEVNNPRNDNINLINP